MTMNLTNKSRCLNICGSDDEGGMDRRGLEETYQARVNLPSCNYRQD